MDTVKINLPNQRMYRLHQDDRTAIRVGPGEVEVPAWVAAAWGIEPIEPPRRDLSVIDEVLAIEGLSKSSIKAIKRHFNLEQTDGDSE